MLSLNKNIFSLFFIWQFFDMPKLILLKTRAQLLRGIDMFSLLIHLRTLFAPWKQDIIPTVNIPLWEKSRIYVMNAISRFFGFMMRTLVIIFGLIYLTIVFVVYAAYLIIWFILPLVAIWLMLYGFKNLF